MRAARPGPVLLLRLEQSGDGWQVHSLGLNDAFAVRGRAALPIVVLGLATANWLQVRLPRSRRAPELKGPKARTLFDALRKKTRYLEHAFPGKYLRLHAGEERDATPSIFLYTPRNERTGEGYAVRINWHYVSLRVETRKGADEGWVRETSPDKFAEIAKFLIDATGEMWRIEVDDSGRGESAGEVMEALVHRLEGWLQRIANGEAGIIRDDLLAVWRACSETSMSGALAASEIREAAFARSDARVSAAFDEAFLRVLAEELGSVARDAVGLTDGVLELLGTRSGRHR